MLHSSAFVCSVASAWWGWWTLRWTGPRPPPPPPCPRWTAPPPLSPPAPQLSIPTYTGAHTPPGCSKTYWGKYFKLKPDNANLSLRFRQGLLPLAAWSKTWVELKIGIWSFFFIFQTCDHQLDRYKVTHTKWVEGGTRIIGLLIKF